jgi:hypothetical protein
MAQVRLVEDAIVKVIVIGVVLAPSEPDDDGEIDAPEHVKENETPATYTRDTDSVTTLLVPVAYVPLPTIRIGRRGRIVYVKLTDEPINCGWL